MSDATEAPQLGSGWRLLRLVAGIILLLVGIPLYILPLPLGAPVLAVAIWLIAGASPRARRIIVGLGRRLPALWLRLRALKRRLRPSQSPTQ